jgi:hypothetical protein
MEEQLPEGEMKFYLIPFMEEMKLILFNSIYGRNEINFI